MCFRSGAPSTCCQFSFDDIERPDKNVGRLDVRVEEPKALRFDKALCVGRTETGSCPRANKEVRDEHDQRQTESHTPRAVGRLVTLVQILGKVVIGNIFEFPEI